MAFQGMQGYGGSEYGEGGADLQRQNTEADFLSAQEREAKKKKKKKGSDKPIADTSDSYGDWMTLANKYGKSEP